jgi:hypothetical protein
MHLYLNPTFDFQVLTSESLYFPFAIIVKRPTLQSQSIENIPPQYPQTLHLMVKRTARAAELPGEKRKTTADVALILHLLHEFLSDKVSY